MDQTTVITTTEFLQSEVAKKDERIAQLEEAHANLARRSYVDSADNNRMVEAMQEWTFSALESGTINEDEALEIAEICGFELIKEFEVEVEVQYSITVNARNEEEAKNAIYDIDFDSVQYNSDSIQYLSSSVDRVDI